jgi:acyl dehydratase
LGPSDSTDVPAGAAAAFAVVPALERVLTHPQVAPRRAAVHLSRIAAEWTDHPRPGETVECRFELTVFERDVTATVEWDAERGASGRVILNVGEGRTAPYTGRPPERVSVGRLEVDAARSLAFSAATWDLNPAYWDGDFARSAGLGGVVCPPALVPFWAARLLEDKWGRRLQSLDARLERPARPGDALELVTSESGNGRVDVLVVSSEGVAMWGSAS